MLHWSDIVANVCVWQGDPLPAKKSNQKIDVYRSVMIDRVYAPCVKTDRPAGRNVSTQHVPLNRINKISSNREIERE